MKRSALGMWALGLCPNTSSYLQCLEQAPSLDHAQFLSLEGRSSPRTSLRESQEGLKCVWDEGLPGQQAACLVNVNVGLPGLCRSVSCGREGAAEARLSRLHRRFLRSPENTAGETSNSAHQDPWKSMKTGVPGPTSRESNQVVPSTTPAPQSAVPADTSSVSYEGGSTLRITVRSEVIGLKGPLAWKLGGSPWEGRRVHAGAAC